MAIDPLDLWPDGIYVNPLSPLKVLQLQAAKLGDKTRGLLTAEVVTGNGQPEYPDDVPSGKKTDHKFEIVAPSLGGYRHQLFVCSHDSQQVYPVCFDDADFHNLTLAESVAATQEEFTTTLRKILSSKRALGLITSLLSRIGESGVTATPA